ncbi:hypothetical protein GW17_00025057 [Ensete ventricosum]|nr:hypothetical protein GW17_00025057 [Ensete ventricosum]RZS01431.1 hypothetical protein BHM03_00031277 [Ensete ventricosum]
MRLLQRLAAKVGIACGGGATTYMLSACRGGWPRPGSLQWRPTMAWLPAREGRPWPGPVQGAATRGHGWLRPTRKGQPAAASPAASRGGGAGRGGGRPLGRRLPTVKGSCCLRRGSSNDGAVRVKEG